LDWKHKGRVKAKSLLLETILQEIWSQTRKIVLDSITYEYIDSVAANLMKEKNATENCFDKEITRIKVINKKTALNSGVSEDCWV
jgi:hypothetical protein